MGNRLEILKMPFVARGGGAAGATPAAAAAAAPSSGGRKLKFLVALLALLMAVNGLIVVYDARQGTFNTLYVAAVGKMRMLSQRLAKAAQQASQGNREAFKQLRESRDEFSALIELLSAGGASAGVNLPPTPESVRPMLAELGTGFKDDQVAVSRILGNMQRLVNAKRATRDMFNDSETLLGAAEQLASGYEQLLTQRRLNFIALAVGSLLALAVLLMIGRAYIGDSRRRAEQSEHQNRDNQNAIMRLLDDIGNLASGDLRVRAKVTEHMTGAIADSINYTIEELRRLVAGITKAAEHVGSATHEAQTVSAELLHAAQKQATEIQGTGQADAHVPQALNQDPAKANA